MGFEERYNNSAGGRPRAKSRADRRRSSQGLEITHFRGVGLRVRSAIQFPPPPPRSGRKFGPYFEHPRGLWQGGPVFRPNVAFGRLSRRAEPSGPRKSLRIYLP